MGRSNAKATTEAAAAETGRRETITGAEHMRRIGEQEHEDVSIKLAHYLPEGNEFTEGGESKQAGETITVKRHVARHLIGAGYAAVDPEDPHAVDAALALGPGDPGEGGEGGEGGEPPADS